LILVIAGFVGSIYAATGAIAVAGGLTNSASFGHANAAGLAAGNADA
jgi:hypothetical protein